MLYVRLCFESTGASQFPLCLEAIWHMGRLPIWSINSSNMFQQLVELAAAFNPMLSTAVASEAPTRIGKYSKVSSPMVRLQANTLVVFDDDLLHVASRLWQDNYLVLVIERGLCSCNGTCCL